tara:strand:- start:738 stop:1385 length:648 start_codon:yes stop_codon:yes gene_type:complete
MKVQKSVSFLLNIILFNVFLLGQLVHAENQHKQYTSLGSHVHGLSEMTMAIEGGTLDIQLISPTINLFGFEHKASNKKEITIVNNAKALLSNTASLFTFSGGACSLINTTINVSNLIRRDDNAYEHQPKDNHKSHDFYNDQQERHEGLKQHEIHNSHNQLIANFRYDCKKISRLSSVKVLVLDQFPGIKNIRVMWISDTKQGVVTLSAERKTLRL